MRTLIRIAAMLAVLIGVATLSGCNAPAGYEVRGGSLCKLGVDGRCYHVGDEWSAYRFDRNFKPHRVR